RKILAAIAQHRLDTRSMRAAQAPPIPARSRSERLEVLFAGSRSRASIHGNPGDARQAPGVPDRLARAVAAALDRGRTNCRSSNRRAQALGPGSGGFRLRLADDVTVPRGKAQGPRSPSARSTNECRRPTASLHLLRRARTVSRLTRRGVTCAPPDESASFGPG